MERPNGIVDFAPDPALYPFESRWFSSSVGPVHYIDEGQGQTLLRYHHEQNLDLRAEARLLL